MFRRDKLTLGRTLGEGAFGKVLYPVTLILVPVIFMFSARSSRPRPSV